MLSAVRGEVIGFWLTAPVPRPAGRRLFVDRLHDVVVCAIPVDDQLPPALEEVFEARRAIRLFEAVLLS